MKYYPLTFCLKSFLECSIHGGDLYSRCPGCRLDLFSPNYQGLRCEVENWQLKKIATRESRRPLFLRSSRFLAIGEVGVLWLKSREVSGVAFHHLPVVGCDSQYFTLEVLGGYEREVLDADGSQECQLCNSFVPCGRKLKFGKISNCDASDFVINQRYSGMAYIKSNVIADLMLKFPGAFELQMLGVRHAMDDGLEASGSDLMG